MWKWVLGTAAIAGIAVFASTDNQPITPPTTPVLLRRPVAIAPIAVPTPTENFDDIGNPDAPRREARVSVDPVEVNQPRRQPRVRQVQPPPAGRAIKAQRIQESSPWPVMTEEPIDQRLPPVATTENEAREAIQIFASRIDGAKTEMGLAIISGNLSHYGNLVKGEYRLRPFGPVPQIVRRGMLLLEGARWAKATGDEQKYRRSMREALAL